MQYFRFQFGKSSVACWHSGTHDLLSMIRQPLNGLGSTRVPVCSSAIEKSIFQVHVADRKIYLRHRMYSE
jgi:hypothetical protein